MSDNTPMKLVPDTEEAAQQMARWVKKAQGYRIERLPDEAVSEVDRWIARQPDAWNVLVQTCRSALPGLINYIDANTAPPAATPPDEARVTYLNGGACPEGVDIDEVMADTGTPTTAGEREAVSIRDHVGIEWSYHEDDVHPPRDFWHVRANVGDLSTDWLKVGEQEQANLTHDQRAAGERMAIEAVTSSLSFLAAQPPADGASRGVVDAARELLDACYRADENSDLSDFIDGVLLTRLDRALSNQKASGSRGEARPSQSNEEES